jgi:hypothetical protein
MLINPDSDRKETKEKQTDDSQIAFCRFAMRYIAFLYIRGTPRNNESGFSTSSNQRTNISVELLQAERIANELRH